LARIYISAYAIEPWSEKWQYEQAKERIYEILSSPKPICYVCEENEVIIGSSLCLLMSWHTGLQLEGKELFVDPPHQRRGVAKALICQVESTAKQLGVTELFFWTKRDMYSVCPNRLVDYYRKLGFSLAEERIVMLKKYEF